MTILTVKESPVEALLGGSHDEHKQRDEHGAGRPAAPRRHARARRAPPPRRPAAQHVRRARPARRARQHYRHGRVIVEALLVILHRLLTKIGKS